jgi:hypothetical protein
MPAHDPSPKSQQFPDFPAKAFFVPGAMINVLPLIGRTIVGLLPVMYPGQAARFPPAPFDLGDTA